MASFGMGNTDFNSVHENGEVIPAGFYQAIIIESGGRSNDPLTGNDGLVQTKNGDGKYLPMTFEVIEGTYKGRRLFVRYNVVNPNPQAVAMARGEIKELLKALAWDFTKNPCGPKDTCEIHNLPLTIQIDVKPDKNSGELRNNVKHYKPRHYTGVGTPAAGGKKPAAAVPSAPPWAKATETNPDGAEQK